MDDSIPEVTDFPNWQTKFRKLLKDHGRVGGRSEISASSKSLVNPAAFFWFTVCVCVPTL